MPDRPDLRGGGGLSLILISEPTRPERTSYAVFCLKKKKDKNVLGLALFEHRLC